jgi:tRNA uridine 5-carboxymethylaminomethyl modification enzyme
MFTSRAEYRLSLREDNADMRLTEIGRELGVVDDVRWEAFSRKREAVSRETARLKSIWVNPKTLPAEDAVALLGKPIDHEYSLADLLRRPGVSYEGLMALQASRYAPPDVLVDDPGLLEQVKYQIEIGIKYQGYIERQAGEIERNEAHENTRLPADLDYVQVRGLSFEVCQKLNHHRPETIGQASRISGVTPAAISLLMVHLKKGLGRSTLKKSAVAADTSLTEPEVVDATTGASSTRSTAQ